jgi:OmpA-OmpF porin, OOP family
MITCPHNEDFPRRFIRLVDCRPSYSLFPFLPVALQQQPSRNAAAGGLGGQLLTIAWVKRALSLTALKRNIMRNILLAAVAVAAFATPALARDGSPYVGVEGGILIAQDLHSDATVTAGTVATRYDDAFTINFKKGADLDALAGYDFGIFRLEGELGYKRFRTDDVTVSASPLSGLAPGDYDLSSKASVLSLMGNALLDFSDDSGWSGYAGVGAGRAHVKLAGDSDSAFAWQAIAGIRKAVSENVEVGLKYRYFNTGRLNFNDNFTDGVNPVGVSTRGKLHTHSLLASLIFNFGAPAVAPVVVAPVVAPPAPPATQTCFDGSVILATDTCPQPPAPAPVPAPTPERG